MVARSKRRKGGLAEVAPSNGERGEGAAKGVAASLCVRVQGLGGEGRLLLLLHNQH